MTKGIYRITNNTTDKLKELPKLTDILNILKTNEFNDLRIPTSIAILALTGCRVSEALTITKSNITFYNGQIMQSYPLPDCSNITRINIMIRTLKKRNETPYRTVVLTVLDIYKDAISWIVKSYNRLTDPQERLIKYKQRLSINNILKKYIDKNFYPHLFRHISATTDSLNGMYPALLKKKYGWSSDKMANRYFNLNDQEMYKAQLDVNKNIELGLLNDNNIQKPKPSEKPLYDYNKYVELSGINKKKPYKLVLE